MLRLTEVMSEVSSVRAVAGESDSAEAIACPRVSDLAKAGRLEAYQVLGFSRGRQQPVLTWHPWVG